MTTRTHTKPNRYPLLLGMLQQLAPDACAEFKFAPTRRWRADFALPTARILVEIDGAIWTNGRHTRGSGFLADMAKMNAAAVLGYRVLRFTPQQARSGAVYGVVAACLARQDERLDRAISGALELQCIRAAEKPCAPLSKERVAAIMAGAQRPGTITAAQFRAQGGKRKGGRG